ncbi:hypothetical protein [Nocardia brevicatena]|uniref:hypothetical protein n=1 Tax=Nocardia brevicatena TaxID=37327 RepID=UPI000594A2D8|nr:hypothetical protein [Nocardia brevicatena]
MYSTSNLRIRVGQQPPELLDVETVHQQGKEVVAIPVVDNPIQCIPGLPPDPGVRSAGQPPHIVQ